MRNPSIFRSTKSGVAKVVELGNSVFDLGIEEVTATRLLNREENKIELTETRINGAMTTAQLTAGAYEQLAKIDAMTSVPADVREQLKANMLKAIS